MHLAGMLNRSTAVTLFTYVISVLQEEEVRPHQPAAPQEEAQVNCGPPAKQFAELHSRVLLLAALLTGVAAVPCPGQRAPLLAGHAC
jgi:hypothetical protein